MPEHSSNMRFCIRLIAFVLSVLTTIADPVPEPDPARLLGKYLVSYHPSDGEYHLTKQPLDLRNIANNDDYYSDTLVNQGDSQASSSGSRYMASYTTSIKHGNKFGNLGSEMSFEDGDDRHTYTSSYKRKPIIPILHSYSIIHSPNQNVVSKDHDDYNNDIDDDEDDYIQTSFTPPKVIHTKAKTVPISQHIEVETPVPVPYVKKIHVPVPKGVKIQIPHPVLVPVPQPYPVHVPVSQPVAVPVIREITIPIEKIVPYPVEKKVPVPIEKPVPYPVEKHIPVHIPQPYPVKVPVVKTIVHKLKPPRTVGVGSVTF
ncbi:mantle protein-like [Sabethes cyaneus]|uniref:mantle protein-like n=1 Tax=Sabethes cyaneus TaxID=53552 RepID=UPI00237E3FE9|nr:mantle protein-like [Sabethes cyaneus]